MSVDLSDTRDARPAGRLPLVLGAISIVTGILVNELLLAFLFPPMA